MAGAPEGNTNRATQYRIKRTLESMWEKHKGSTGVDLLEKACEAQLLKAAEGDLASFREVADRLDGKPTQATELSGPDGEPLKSSLTVEFVGTVPGQT
jgi:hypothetical protein